MSRALLATCLWKEWNDHRTPLLVILMLIPLACVLAVTLPHGLPVGPVGFMKTVSVSAVLLVVVVVASDTISGELRNGTMRCLRRMPSGMWQLLAGKLAFVGVTTMAAALVGATTAFVTLVAGGSAPTLDGFWYHQGAEVSGLGLVSLVIVFAPWLLQTTCWLPRPSMAIALAAVVCVPSLVLFVLAGNGRVDLMLESWQVRCLVASVAAAGLAALVVSFGNLGRNDGLALRSRAQGQSPASEVSDHRRLCRTGRPARVREHARWRL